MNLCGRVFLSLFLSLALPPSPPLSFSVFFWRGGYFSRNEQNGPVLPCVLQMKCLQDNRAINSPCKPVSQIAAETWDGLLRHLLMHLCTKQGFCSKHASTLADFSPLLQTSCFQFMTKQSAHGKIL